jgi:hypothetical protein
MYLRDGKIGGVGRQYGRGTERSVRWVRLVTGKNRIT